MILVFYIALVILLLIALVIYMIYISKLEISIENLDMSNINKRKNNEKIIIQISLKLGNIKWLHFKMNKEKLANLYGKIQKFEYKNSISSKIMKEEAKKEIKIMLENKEIKQKILNTKIELEKFDSNISFGTEDYILTSYLVAIVAIIISNILPHIIKNKESINRIKYSVLPIYQQRNIYNIQLNTILNIKVARIINIAFALKKANKNQERKNQHYKYKNIENLKKIKVQTV